MACPQTWSPTVEYSSRLVPIYASLGYGGKGQKWGYVEIRRTYSPCDRSNHTYGKKYSVYCERVLKSRTIILFVRSSVCWRDLLPLSLANRYAAATAYPPHSYPSTCVTRYISHIALQLLFTRWTCFSYIYSSRIYTRMCVHTYEYNNNIDTSSMIVQHSVVVVSQKTTGCTA